ILVSKYVVATAGTIAVMIPSIFLTWLAMPGARAALIVPLSCLAGVAIGAALYGALFVALGVISRKALVTGLLYIVVLEFVVSRQVAGTRSLSIREFALTVMGNVGSGQPAIQAGNVSTETVWVMGGFFLLASMVAALAGLIGFEIAERA